MGYTNEIEKLTRNDSKLLLKIKLKNPLVRKCGLEFRDTLWVNIFVRWLCRQQTNNKTQDVFDKKVNVSQESDLEE